MQQKQVNLRLILVAAPVIVAMIVLGKFQKLPITVESPSFMIMGTQARILVVAPDSKTAYAAINAGFKAMELVDGLMSSYRENSELSIINEEAYETPVPVSPETFAVLAKSQEISRLSDGAFDITIAPLLDLWNQAADANTPPTEIQIAAARGQVGWEKLLLDPNTQTVRFAVPGMKLNLGGIAKGYGIDRALDAVRDANAVGAMVDIGGDIRCFGTPPYRKKHWNIGLQDPNVSSPELPGGYLLVLNINDQAIATSGHYRRFTLVDGRKVSHILEPSTGKGSHRLASSTIIAPDALTADALATTVSVMGADKGMALIEKLDGVEALLIPDANHVEDRLLSTNIKRFIASKN